MKVARVSACLGTPYVFLSNGIFMWRNRRNPTDRRIDVPSILAGLFAAAVLGGMVWMAITGNNFCCDSSSLVGQLYRQLSTGK